MTTSVKTRANWIAGLTVAGFLALIFAAIGCGNEHTSIEQERVELHTRPASAPEPSITVTTTPIEPAAPVEAPAIEEPERDSMRPVTYAEAEAAFTEKRYNDAVDLFDRYTVQKPSNAWGFYMLGLSSWRAGEYNRAKEALEKAIDIDPRHVKSWINLSRVHLDDQNSVEAIAALDAALTIDPNNKTVYRLKGRALHQQGLNEDALAAYRQALSLDEKDAWSMNNMALVLIDEGRFDEALPLLALAVSINDQVPLFYNNLGMVLEHLGQFRAAEDAYAAAVELDSTYDKAVANLARVEAVEQDPDVHPVDLDEMARNGAAKIAGWKIQVSGEEEAPFEF